MKLEERDRLRSSRALIVELGVPCEQAKGMPRMATVHLNEEGREIKLGMCKLGRIEIEIVGKRRVA